MTLPIEVVMQLIGASNEKRVGNNKLQVHSQSSATQHYKNLIYYIGNKKCHDNNIFISNTSLRPEFIVATFAKEKFFFCKGTISSLARLPLQRYP